MTGWWRQNRLWLPAVPIALAAALYTSSWDAVRENWYDLGPHDELASAGAGEFAHATDEYDDPLGPTSRTFSVRVAEVEESDTFPFDSFEEPAPPPDGLQPLVVHLDWEAEPDQVMSGCTVSLVDDEGRRYEVIDDTRQDECVNFDQRGPNDPVSVDGVRGEVPSDSEPRPATWSTAPVFLVPEGTEIRQVLVWWQLPRYVALSAS